MEEIENREQDLIQHLRTAGLQKRREIALVDEVLELRKEKRKLFSALYAKLANVTSDHTLLTERSKHFVEDTQRELSMIKEQYASKVATMQEQLSGSTAALEEENAKLKEQNQALKDGQAALSSKYSSKIHLLEDKIQQLAKMQKVTESTLRQDIEATLKKTLSRDIAVQYEVEMLRLKEAIRGISDRENDLKGLCAEQKVALKAYQADNENMKEQYRRSESNVRKLQAEVYEHKLAYEKLQLRVEGFEATIAAKEAALTAAAETHTSAVEALKAQHDKELEVIASRVKAAMGKKTDAVSAAEEALERCEREKRRLEASLEELSNGLVTSGGGKGGARGGSASSSGMGRAPPMPPSDYSRYSNER